MRYEIYELHGKVLDEVSKRLEHEAEIKREQVRQKLDESPIGKRIAALRKEIRRSGD